MFSVIPLPLPACRRDATSRLSVNCWVTQMPILPCSGMCTLIYHESDGRFNASFQEDRTSISSQINQKISVISLYLDCTLSLFHWKILLFLSENRKIPRPSHFCERQRIHFILNSNRAGESKLLPYSSDIMPSPGFLTTPGGLFLLYATAHPFPAHNLSSSDLLFLLTAKPLPCSRYPPDRCLLKC